MASAYTLIEARNLNEAVEEQAEDTSPGTVADSRLEHIEHTLLRLLHVSHERDRR